MEARRIAVVGLGVAGGTVGMLLARMGHGVRVFEQTAEPGAVGAGVLLQPSGHMVLRRLGLLERVVERAERIERLVAVTHRGGTLIDLGYGEIGEGACAYGLHRGELFSVLYEELKGSGAELELGKRVVRYENGAAGVKAYAEDGACVGEFDLLIAADGARSVLRGCNKQAMRVHEYPHGAVWAIGRACTAVRGKLWQVTQGSKRLCGLLPMGEGRCSLFWSLERREREQFLADGFEKWREEVVRLCPEAEEIFQSVTSLEQTRFTTYMHVRMKRPMDGRVLFMGDAGHAMSPHLGQGINLALIDAYCFGHAMRGAKDVVEACEMYAELRRVHVNLYSAITYTLSPFFQSRGFVKGFLRDVFLPWMPKVGWLRRRMVMTMAGLRGGYVRRRYELPEDVEL